MNYQQQLQYYEKSKNKFRIFQIGFNKCGTRSLNHLMKRNNIKSVHYGGGKIAETMFRHYKNNEPLIDIRYRDIVFFSDMESVVKPKTPLYVAQTLFKELYQQYPNSIFLLNVRDKEKWLLSRINHGNRKHEVEYLKTICEKTGMSEEETIDYWSNEWDKHIKNVLDFFKNKPGKLIVYNIEKQPIESLVKKLKPFINLNSELYKHLGKT